MVQFCVPKMHGEAPSRAENAPSYKPETAPKKVLLLSPYGTTFLQFFILEGFEMVEETVGLGDVAHRPSRIVVVWYRGCRVGQMDIKENYTMPNRAHRNT